MPAKLIPALFGLLLKLDGEELQQLQDEALLNNKDLQAILCEVLMVLNNLKKLLEEDKAIGRLLAEMRTLSQKFFERINFKKLDSLTILYPLSMELEKDIQDQQKDVKHIIRLMNPNDAPQFILLTQALQKFCASTLPQSDGDPWRANQHIKGFYDLVSQAGSKPMKHILACMGLQTMALIILRKLNIDTLQKNGFGFGMDDNNSATKSSSDSDFLGRNATRKDPKNLLCWQKSQWKGMFETAMIQYFGGTDLPEVLPDNSQIFDLVLKTLDKFCAKAIREKVIREKVNGQPSFTIEQILYAFRFPIKAILEAACNFQPGDGLMKGPELKPFKVHCVNLSTEPGLNYQQLFTFVLMKTDDLLECPENFDKKIQEYHCAFVTFYFMIQPANGVLRGNFNSAYNPNWTYADLAMWIVHCMVAGANQSRDFAEQAFKTQVKTPFKAQVKDPSKAQVKDPSKAQDPSKAPPKTWAEMFAEREPEPERRSKPEPERRSKPEPERRSKPEPERRSKPDPQRWVDLVDDLEDEKAGRVAEREPTKREPTKPEPTTEEKLIVKKIYMVSDKGAIDRLSDTMTRQSDTMTRQSDTIARLSDTVTRLSDTVTRQSDTVTRQSEEGPFDKMMDALTAEEMQQLFKAMEDRSTNPAFFQVQN